MLSFCKMDQIPEILQDHAEDVNRKWCHDKSEKPDGPVLGSGCSNFDSFRVKIEGKENTRRFEVQILLRHGKGEMSIKE
jgi:hypothetical protein